VSEATSEETAPAFGEAPEATMHPASAARRIAAGLLDAGLLLVALGFVFATELALASGGEQDVFLAGWLVLFAPLFFALYHAYGTGATPGQLELRSGMRDSSTRVRPALGRAVVRSYLGFAFLVLVLPALADLVSLATGRSLRDRITRTTVVRIRLEGKAPELSGATEPELVRVFNPPEGTREYLRRGLELLRARPRMILGTTTALYAVLVAIAVLLAFLVVVDSPDIWTISSYVLLVFLLLGSGIYWMQAAVVVAAEDARIGGPDASVWSTLVRCSRRVNALTAALLLLLGFVGLSMMLFFVPLLFVGRFALVAPAIVLEDTRVLGAFRRSWQLTRGKTMRLFGLVLLSYLALTWLPGAATMIPVMTVTAIAGETAALVASVAVGAVLFVVVLAWLGAAWALVYEDARRARPAGDPG
jgi:hypothetical protein